MPTKTRPFLERYRRMQGASVELLTDTGGTRSYRITAPEGEPHEVNAILLPVTGWVVDACDCAAFQFVKDARGCVHCERVREELGFRMTDEKSTYEPGKHMIKVQGGRDYLTAAGRVQWFRQDHPQGCIKVDPHTIDVEKRFAIFCAEVLDGEGHLLARDYKYEDAKGFPDYIEKAATGAAARALGKAGYGTDDVDDEAQAYEGNVRPADAPVARRGPQAPKTTPPKPAMPVNRPQDGDADYPEYKRLYQASKAVIDTLGPDGQAQVGGMLDAVAFPNAALGQLTMDQMQKFHGQLIKTFAEKVPVTT